MNEDEPESRINMEANAYKIQKEMIKDEINKSLENKFYVSG